MVLLLAAANDTAGAKDKLGACVPAAAAHAALETEKADLSRFVRHIRENSERRTEDVGTVQKLRQQTAPAGEATTATPRRRHPWRWVLVAGSHGVGKQGRRRCTAQRGCGSGISTRGQVGAVARGSAWETRAQARESRRCPVKGVEHHALARARADGRWVFGNRAGRSGARGRVVREPPASTGEAWRACILAT